MAMIDFVPRDLEPVRLFFSSFVIECLCFFFSVLVCFAVQTLYAEGCKFKI